MKGPVPIATFLKLRSEFGTIAAKTVPRFARNGAKGCESVTRTVYGSTMSTFVMTLKRSALMFSGSFASIRSKLKATSSAFISRPLIGGTSWNLTPFRRKNVYDLPSLLISQRSASAGSMMCVPGGTSGPVLNCVNPS